MPPSSRPPRNARVRTRVLAVAAWCGLAGGCGQTVEYLAEADESASVTADAFGDAPGSRPPAKPGPTPEPQAPPMEPPADFSPTEPVGEPPLPSFTPETFDAAPAEETPGPVGLPVELPGEQPTALPAEREPMTAPALPAEPAAESLPMAPAVTFDESTPEPLTPGKPAPGQFVEDDFAENGSAADDNLVADEPVADEPVADEPIAPPLGTPAPVTAAAEPPVAEKKKSSLRETFADILGEDSSDSPREPSTEPSTEPPTPPPADAPAAVAQGPAAPPGPFAEALASPGPPPALAEAVAAEPADAEPFTKRAPETGVAGNAFPPAPNGLPKVLPPVDTPPLPPSAAPSFAERLEIPEMPPPAAVTVTNTRRLAWLLGSKMSWSAMSHLISPQPLAADDWETQALAELLGVDNPPESQSASRGATPARAIGRVLSDSRRLAAQLSSRHGDDHAALVEVAVKTNVLLVVYEQNPALAGPIAGAVSKAAERAGLPNPLWDPMAELLEGEPTAESLRDEVFRLHSGIDRTLAEAAN